MARGEQLRMRGGCSYVASYVYLRAPPTPGTRVRLRLGASGAAPDAAIYLA